MKLFKSNKALLFSFFLLCICVNITQAQVGIKLGTTVSSFYYTDKEMVPNISYEIDLGPYLGYDINWVQLGNQNPLVSTYVGVYYNLQLNNRIGFRPEWCFTQKGVNFSQSEYERIIYKVKISYLEVPLSFAYKFINKEKFIGEIYLGGYGAFKLKAIKKVASNNSSIAKTKLTTVESIDIGWHFGINFKTRILAQHILFDIRFFQGLRNVFYVPENQVNIYHSTQKTKITGFNFTVGYEF